MNVGIVDDIKCEQHHKNYFDKPQRVIAIRDKLKSSNIYDKLKKIDPIEPTLEDLLLVHTNAYINKVSRICNHPTATLGNDVIVNGKNSLTAALTAVGSVISAVNTVLTTNTKKIFCNVRPPGHHASSHEAAGFCIFNNVAIGAKKALTYKEIKKVLIFDWDLHHGDGTQKLLQSDDRVMFCSFHKADIYPGSGNTSKNNVHNYPQNGNIEIYMDEFLHDFLPKAYEFQPDIIFISCGFDGHKDDLYGELQLDYEHFQIMTRELCLLANKFANGRLISVLEGGYTLDVLAQCALTHINEMLLHC